MHDLIQEMGLQIVREESIDELGARSRLSDFGEICDVLANNAGTNKVEGIQLDVTQIRDLHLEADIFKKMHNIRFLKFYSRFDCDSSHVHLPDGLKFLPNKIRYLEWYGFPLKSLPSTFCPEKIVKLFMPNSRLQKLWDGVQDFSNLEKINLSGSKQLKELPDLSKSLNLKDLKLASCESLCDVHSSIWSLPSLYSLMLSGCKKLKSLKSEFPLKSPKWIDVSDCSDLIELPVLSEENTRLALCETSFCKSRRELERELTIFNLDGSTLVGFPRQLSWLRSLTDLALFECGVIDDLKLHFLFDRMLSLTEVWLCGCCNITELPNNTKHLLRLERLRLSCCNRLRSLLELPPSVTTIKVIDCKWLETVPAFEPLNGGQIDLAFWRCKRLNEESCHNIMGAVYYAICHALPENKNHMHSYKIQVEGSRVPQWFKYRAAKSTVTVELPRISDLLDFSFCMAFYDDVEHGYSGGCFQLKWACYLDGSQVDGKSFLHSDPEMGSDQVWIWNDTKMCREVMQGIRRGGNQQLFTDTKLSFEFTVEEFYRGQTLGIRECGAWPVYGSECEKFFRHKEREKNKKRARDADEQMPLAEPNRTKFEVGPHIPELNALLMTMHIT
ncbi:disease resistance protein RML1B-like [Prosopis cineraria]|uniref:disease resistance protein RML1B-like n=1 Tax=Prosopis cineraria TaxID=364024 RepID=UPI00240F757B|nr:disease resistance protein RML1B-like [Prosopis cineraria]